MAIPEILKLGFAFVCLFLIFFVLSMAYHKGLSEVADLLTLKFKSFNKYEIWASAVVSILLSILMTISLV